MENSTEEHEIPGSGSSRYGNVLVARVQTIMQVQQKGTIVIDKLHVDVFKADSPAFQISLQFFSRYRPVVLCILIVGMTVLSNMTEVGNHISSLLGLLLFKFFLITS